MYTIAIIFLTGLFYNVIHIHLILYVDIINFFYLLLFIIIYYILYIIYYILFIIIYKGVRDQLGPIGEITIITLTP